MHFVIAGGTGYVGRHLCDSILLDENNRITILTHSALIPITREIKERYPEHMDRIEILSYNDYHGEGHVLINLAGENLGTKKITSKRLNSIKQSRLNILEHLNQCKKLPKIFMQASAVSCYPNSTDIQDEHAPTDASSDFGGIISALENKVLELNEKFNFKHYYLLRLGIVMSSDGGLMRKVSSIYPFKLLKGNNYVPFIAMDDLIKAIHFILNKELPSGPINLTSPRYATINELLKHCFKDRRAPTMYIWNTLLHIGDRRVKLIEANQRIKPRVLLNAGFIFRCDKLSQIS